MTVKEFDQYFRSMYLPLGMYAMRIVGDADSAEDLVSDAFLKAWQLIEAGGEINHFQAYMYRSVRNECVQFLRNRKETVGMEHIPEADDEAVDTSMRDARIWRAIDNLPQRCREIFLLSKRDGLTNDEIAEELGLSVKTVKNQMTKAYTRLREALATGHKPFFLPFL